MRVTESGNDLTFVVTDAWLAEPARAGLASWLADHAEVEITGDGSTRVTFDRASWSAWGALLPPGAGIEEREVWRAHHEHLAVLAGIVEQRVRVSAVGYVGAPGLTLRMTVNGEEIAVGARSPLVASAHGPLLLLPALFAAAGIVDRLAPGMDQPEHLAIVGQLQTHARRLEELAPDGSVRLALELDEHLSSIAITYVDRVAPRWSTRGPSGAMYELGLDVRTEGAEGYAPLPLGGLHSSAPLVSVSGHEHYLLSPDVAEVARSVKPLRNKLRKQVADVLADPGRVVPTGIASESVDLSRYSSRIAGFEPVVRADRPIDVRASGVAWYDRDDVDGPFLRLHVAQGDGTDAELTFATRDDVQSFVDESERAKPGAVVRVSGRDVVPTPALVGAARETLAMHELRRARAAEAAAGKDSAELEEPVPKPPSTGRVAAIIKEVDAATPLAAGPEIDEDAVPWGQLDELLLPGIGLKPHQREGIAWLWHHRSAGASGVLLADDMGLGKTLQVAAFLALSRFAEPSAERRPSLVVAPIILLANWDREIDKFFRPEAFPRRLTLHGAELARRKKHGNLDVTGLGGFDLVLTNYETLGSYQQQLLAVDFATVVLDEAQAIKNPDALRTRGARGLKRRFAICSTGTPVENRLLDLWALYDFLSPGRPFGPRAEFEQRFENPEEPAIPALREALLLPAKASTLLRRTKKEALKSLPPKIEHQHAIAMTGEQVSNERLIVNEKVPIFEKLHKLQKLYQHPRLLKRAEGVERRELTVDEIVAESPKLALTLGILEEIRQKREKAIVFTLWTNMQDLLAQVFRARFGLSQIPIVNGETNQRGGAQPRLDAFAAIDGFALMILSPLAAGAGLTITAANHVVHYGRWWNPAKEDQATDRAYRIGQERTVHVHYPILHHPHDPERGFDVKLHALVTKKRAMARDFLDPRNQEDPSEEDLFEGGTLA